MSSAVFLQLCHVFTAARLTSTSLFGSNDKLNSFSAAGDTMTGTLMQPMMTPEEGTLRTTRDQLLQGKLRLEPASKATAGWSFELVGILKAVFSRGQRQATGPKSYKHFMMELPDEITPEDAQKKYDEYLTDFWGSARKAYFQSIKDKPE